MMIVFLRSAIIFITLLIIMRLMGKRQIGEMQPFELVITLVIAELACIPMSDVSIPLLYGVVAIIALFILHQLVSLIENLGTSFKKVISGMPSIVLNKNGVDFKELKKNGMSVEELIESMRTKGYFALDDLQYGIFEANGTFSALENNNLQQKEKNLSLLIINEGKINYKNLEMAGLDEGWLLKTLLENNLKSPKNIMVFTLDKNGRVYCQEKGEKYKILNLTLVGGKVW